jgi:hypothetical protein
MSPIITSRFPVLLKLLVVLPIVFGYLLVARVVRGVPARRRRRH